MSNHTREHCCEPEKTGNKKKIFSAVFFLLLTIFAAGALYEKYHTESGSFFLTGEKGTMRSFDPLEVKKMELSWKNNTVTLILGKDDLWHIKERNMTEASAARVSDLLHLFQSIRILKELKDVSPEILQKLNLTEKEDKNKGILPGIKVVLKNGSEKELFKMILGSGHYPPASKDSPETIMAKGRYILVDNRVFLASQLFEMCVPLPQVYVEPLAIRNMNSAIFLMYSETPGEKKVKGEHLTPVWAAVRNKNSNRFRLLIPTKSSLDMKKFVQISETLAKQLTSDILPSENPPDIPIQKQITIHHADGFSYILNLAKRNKEELLMPLVKFDTDKFRRYTGESNSRYQARLAGAKLRFESEKRYYNGKVFHMVPGVMEKLSIIPVSTQKMSSSAPRTVKKVSGNRSGKAVSGKRK